MDAKLTQLIWKRARRKCEYCQISQDYDELTFEIDHIIAIKHGGPTRASNLCLACLSCNSFKGSNIAGIDPKTRKISRLFNPRRQVWEKHFQWEGPVLIGLTPVGRVTIGILKINDPFRIELRERLIEENLFPLD